MITEDDLKGELEAMKIDLIRRYNELGMRASGSWGASLGVETSLDDRYLRGVITGLDYTVYMQRGRAGGVMPPIAAIEQWIKDKGILPIERNMKLRGLAWAIARSIANEGTRRYRDGGKPDFIDEVITAERVQGIIERVGYAAALRFRSEIINFIKDMGL